MSYDNPDVYGSPEKFGLEEVVQIDFSDGNYCFDYRTIWRQKSTGKLFTARDSGCSCPSPFENYHGIKDLQEFSLSLLEDEAKEEAASAYYSGDPITPYLEKIRGLK